MEPTVTISLEAYNRLLDLKKILREKHSIIFNTSDGYYMGTLYISDANVMKEIKEVIGSIISDYEYPLNTPEKRKGFFESLFS